MITESSVAEILTIFRAAYGNRMRVDENVIAIWAESIPAPSEPLLDQVARDWVKWSADPPTISEFLNACQELIRQQKMTGVEPTPPETPASGAARNYWGRIAQTLSNGLRSGQHLPDAIADISVPAELEYAAGVGSHRCKRCRDSDWEFLPDGSVKPCSACNPEQYETWMGGHYGSNHRCAECSKLAASKGRR